MTTVVIVVVGFGILTAVAIMAGAAADTLRQRNIRIERQLDLVADTLNQLRDDAAHRHAQLTSDDRRFLADIGVAHWDVR